MHYGNWQKPFKVRWLICMLIKGKLLGGLQLTFLRCWGEMQCIHAAFWRCFHKQEKHVLFCVWLPHLNLGPWVALVRKPESHADRRTLQPWICSLRAELPSSTFSVGVTLPLAWDKVARWGCLSGGRSAERWGLVVFFLPAESSGQDLPNTSFGSEISWPPFKLGRNSLLFTWLAICVWIWIFFANISTARSHLVCCGYQFNSLSGFCPYPISGCHQL